MNWRILSSLFSISILVSMMSGCGKSSPVVLPTVSGSDVAQSRSTSSSTFEFVIALDKTSTSEATIDYTTKAGTAEATKDFLPTSGTLSIPAGSKTGSIKITVTGDSTRKADQNFTIELSNPKNCTLPIDHLTATIHNDVGIYYPVANTGYTTPTSYPGYTLVWSDEFTNKTIDDTNWSFETGNNNGWGNHELEYYTGRSQNVFTSQGNLVLEARVENFASSNFTSTRMITKGKRSFTLGRVDIRAMLPQGKGIWPALWMLGSNIDAVGWPSCGEIDMMELLGQQPNKVYGTLHWGPTHQSYGTNYSLTSGAFSDSFHVFSMIWKANSIELLIDDVSYFTMDTSKGGLPFNAGFFFIFNIAVGGDWPGAPDASTIFPQRMVVDYIRVFQ
ncbi:MAG: family 16 glycosylhydrolase [Bacteroidetes bacterium]|nr:family 16 glycosylhydrolase [Bacteroidota bacterium]